MSVSTLTLGQHTITANYSGNSTDAASTASISQKVVQNTALTLTANPNYWGGAPSLQKLVFKIAPESATRLQQVESGETDVTIYLTPVSTIHVLSKLAPTI